MPAKDYYHDTVKRALVKDGWVVSKEQVKLKIGKRRLWIDLLATKSAQSLAILIEVKGFENSPSLIEELGKATGQYVIYRAAIAAKQLDMPLYLAVPLAAFSGILSEDLGKQVTQETGIKLLVFDPVKEEIVRWIP
jgi:hypothetical protein